MTIKPFDDTYLEEFAQLFKEEYSEDSKRRWTLEVSKKYLHRNADTGYSFVALDEDGVCMGVIMCNTGPYYQGEQLFIDDLLVKKEYRSKKVATTLLRYILNLAKKNKIQSIHFIADTRKSFPKSWYERVRFKATGWVEYDLFTADIK